MKGNTTLTADAVQTLRDGIKENTPVDVASRIANLPPQGYELEWEKPEFSLSLEEFIKWIGDEATVQKLAVEHVKFNFAGAIRALLAKQEYTPEGELTPENRKAVKAFIKEWKYVPGRSGRSLSERDQEDLEKDYTRMLARQAAIEAELKRRQQG